MRIHELGHVVLYVSELEKMANFYRDLLGFREIHRSEGMAVFSSGRTHHELLLIEVGGEPQPNPRFPAPGLYHIGFKIGNSTEDVKAAFAELEKHHVTILGTGDHGVTHSLYILDPDGNELELYADVSDAWKTDPGAIMRPTKPLILY